MRYFHNSFNNYFVDVGPNLAKNITLDVKSFASYLTRTHLCINRRIDDQSGRIQAIEKLNNEFKESLGVT